MVNPKGSCYRIKKKEMNVVLLTASCFMSASLVHEACCYTDEYRDT